MVICANCDSQNRPSASHCRGCGILIIKPHSRSKYRVLSGFVTRLRALTQNIAYFETHGGTGKVLDAATATMCDGSVRTVAQAYPSIPCVALEIHPRRAELLRQNTRDLVNVNVLEGNCNILVNQVLQDLSGYGAIFCFCDPHGLVYHRGRFSCREVEWPTIEQIARFRNTDLLFTYPVLALFRNAAQVLKRPMDPRSTIKTEHITALIGDSTWRGIPIGDYRTWVRFFIHQRLMTYYRFNGALLLRNSVHAPVLYFIFGSNNHEHGRIMREIMLSEYQEICRVGGRFAFKIEDADELFIYDF